MIRFVIKALTVLVLAALVAAGLLVAVSDDPLYTSQALVFQERFRCYDSLIRDMAEKHGVEPELVKAVIWRESAFAPDKIGGDGERGLMQILPGAASDWVRVNRVQNFDAADLFDPKTNIDAGTWYLKQALARWKDRDNPLVFALAQYNAGSRRVEQWIADTNLGTQAGADDLRAAITFPTTRKYVDDILDRRAFYLKRGRL
jgi:soluble lytic murein transglycosylase